MATGEILTILCGDAIERLRTLPDNSVHCCVTSPPYWGLRDYGTAQWEGGEDGCDHAEPPRGGRNPETAGKQLANAGTLAYQFAHDCGKCGAKRIDSQLGLEKTPEEYVAKMVVVFREVRRVLRKDGTLWLNLGDSFNGLKVGSTQENVGARRHNTDTFRKEMWTALKPKDLCGIPWRMAFALQADGWWLRSDIIWSKPNPMPESVTDRPTKAHEYLFLLTKSANYFYDADAIKEPGQDWGDRDGTNWRGRINNPSGPQMGCINGDFSGGRNKRSVWTVATAPYPEAHFATYPPDLIKPCILAGTSAKGCCAKCGAPWERIVESKRIRRDEFDPTDERYRPNRYKGAYEDINGKGDAGYSETKTIGWQPTCQCLAGFEGFTYCPPRDTIPCTVLDPFAGSGTTGAVALELGRKAILIELNPKYVELIKTRCNVTMGLALA